MFLGERGDIGEDGVNGISPSPEYIEQVTRNLVQEEIENMADEFKYGAKIEIPLVNSVHSLQVKLRCLAEVIFDILYIFHKNINFYI